MLNVGSKEDVNQIADSVSETDSVSYNHRDYAGTNWLSVRSRIRETTKWLGILPFLQKKWDSTSQNA